MRLSKFHICIQLETYTPSVITNNAVIIAEGVFFMPKTKFENFILTVIMAFILVYAMICYNIALNIE